MVKICPAYLLAYARTTKVRLPNGVDVLRGLRRVVMPVEEFIVSYVQWLLLATCPRIVGSGSEFPDSAAAYLHSPSHLFHI